MLEYDIISIVEILVDVKIEKLDEGDYLATRDELPGLGSGA